MAVICVFARKGKWMASVSYAQVRSKNDDEVIMQTNLVAAHTKFGLAVSAITTRKSIAVHVRSVSR